MDRATRAHRPARPERRGQDDAVEEKPGASGALTFGISSELPAYRIRESLAYAVLPEWPSCPGPYRAGQLREYAQLWLIKAAGGAEKSSAKFTADMRNVVHEVLQRPLPEQGEWYQQVAAAVESCSPPPPLESL